ncbi:MAG: alpha/beta fold hydrolase [Actinomycetota bacterium]
MIGDPAEGRYVPVEDTRLWVLEMGEGHPMFLIHGGPGLDHTQFRPWLDPLAERFRLIFVDLRGQGRSDLVDPATLSIDRMAADIDPLAAALGLGSYAVLGHSFGSFVTLQHAVSSGRASHYVLIGSMASARWLDRVEKNLAEFEPDSLGPQVEAAWDAETSVDTVDGFRKLLVDQLPFHFSDPRGEPLAEFVAGVGRMHLSADVLRTFANRSYGGIEVEDSLAGIESPVLVISAEHDRVTVPEAGWEIAEAVPSGECVLIKNAGHMMFVEKPKAVRRVIEAFFDRFPLPGMGTSPPRT